MLIKKEEIVVWRRNYLRQIKEVRNMNTRPYYTDETWINEGLIVSEGGTMVIQSRRQAFLQGFSTGLKSPSEKGQRLIISDIGSTTGFLEHGLLVFQSRRKRAYHEDMESNVFEN